MKTAHLELGVITTDCGVFHIAASEKGVVRVFLPGADKKEIVAIKTKVSRDFDGQRFPWIDLASSELRGYLQGDVSEFSVPVDFSGVSEFRRKVYGALVAVPYGQTVTYGDLGRMVGYRGGARAVGAAMRCNSVPILVPCHRVLPAAGGTGGWSGPPGWKQKLLELERQGRKKFSLVLQNPQTRMD